MIQPILDFFLNFLKLAQARILFGVLIAVGVAEGFVIHEKDLQIERTTIENKKLTDSLTSVIINEAVKHSIEKVQIMKECYDDKLEMSRGLGVEIIKTKKALKK